MKKELLIEKLINTFTGMGSDSPEDVASCNKINLTQARVYLAELRANERKADLTDAEKLPAEVNPALYKEAFNCYIEKCRHDIKKEAFVEWLKNVEPWDVYESYCEVNKLALSVVYTDWLLENMSFPFPHENQDEEGEISMLDLIVIGQHSPKFNPGKEYCCYDPDTHEMYTTDTPFTDGKIDAESVAEWLLQDNEALDYVYNTHADTVPNCWIWGE